MLFDAYDDYSDCFFFFFKQKTAYEIRLSLVGSEMCIKRQGVNGINLESILVAFAGAVVLLVGLRLLGGGRRRSILR